MSSKSTHLRNAEKGMALVIVLWMVSLLTIMAGSFSLSTQRNTGLVKTAQERAKGLALAEAAVNYAMVMLSLPDVTKRWRSDGMPYQVVLPGGRVDLVIFDESGKIDLNAASNQTMRNLFAKITGNEEMATALADRILDWRDGDGLKRINGAEAQEYQAADKPYVPQNKNFQTLDELQMVLGMTPALYKRLQPFLTLYAAQDGFNPQKASAETLQKLLGMDEASVLEYLKLRRTAGAVAPLPPVQNPALAIPLTSGADSAYTIVAQAHSEDAAGVGLEVIARRQFSRANGTPFAFVSWKQQITGSHASPDHPAP